MWTSSQQYQLATNGWLIPSARWLLILPSALIRFAVKSRISNTLNRHRAVLRSTTQREREREMGGILSSSSGGGGSSSSKREETEMALSKAKGIVSSNPVVVFSKTYCGYCKRVKQLLSQLGATFKVVELDQESDGDEIQAALKEWTGQRTVPNVFIGGNHIGGCDDVTALHNQGKLVPLLTEAGAITNNSEQL